MTERRDTIIICVKYGSAHVLSNGHEPAKWESVASAGKWVRGWTDHPSITPADVVVVVDTVTGETEVFA